MSGKNLFRLDHVLHKLRLSGATSIFPTGYGRLVRKSPSLQNMLWPYLKTARPKINSQSQIFRYGRSIFLLPHRPKFSDLFDLWVYLVSVVRVSRYVKNGAYLPDEFSHQICISWESKIQRSFPTTPPFCHFQLI